MSATIEERLASLKRFSPKAIVSYLDEDRGVEFQLTFYPSLNAFKVHRSDEPPMPAGIQLPLLTISYSDFINGEIKFNPANRMDQILKSLKDEWDSLSEEEKEDFFDSIPLNSLYIGANPVIH